MRRYADASFLVALLNPKDSGHDAALNHKSQRGQTLTVDI